MAMRLEHESLLLLQIRNGVIVIIFLRVMRRQVNVLG
jgi:hypothetical protein